ncbi:unnamed protein product, partial [marine sediment metagenome]
MSPQQMIETLHANHKAMDRGITPYSEAIIVIKLLLSEKKQLRERAEAAEHFIVETGETPGVNTNCRCGECQQ